MASLTNIEKAAALIISLGTESSARIFKGLSQEEVEKLSHQITRMRTIAHEDKLEVLKEAAKRILSNEFSSMGGKEVARRILEEALGKEKAQALWKNLGDMDEGTTPFSSLKGLNITQITSFIRNEKPQTIALILSHLDAGQSASILSALAPELQAEVVLRIATMDQTTPQIIEKIEGVIKQQLVSSFSQRLDITGGAKAVAEVLNHVDRGTERSIMESLEEKEPELAEEVKKLMFVFEDLILVEDRSLQRVLKEVDSHDLALALKASSAEIKEKIFGNISKRAAETIAEEIEYMGPIRLKVVEEAQQKIVNVIRRLDEEGEIVISGRGGGGGEELVV